jgi:hypothetical protein
VVSDYPTVLIEPDPAIPPGCSCSECERPYGLSHLGTCSRSGLMGGSGIVGFRVAREMASTESLESKTLAEKEGFEPSFPAKSHGNSVGFPSEHPDHE